MKTFSQKSFLADRTAACTYDQLLAWYCCLSVCLSVCDSLSVWDEVYCG